VWDDKVLRQNKDQDTKQDQNVETLQEKLMKLRIQQYGHVLCEQ
jgi:hypothetical protein